MAEYKDREHFIPLRKSDLIQLLCRDKQLDIKEREPFRQFGRLVSSVFHFEYLQRLEELKDAYAPFDPDADTRPLQPLLPEEKQQRLEQMFDDFTKLMERANFKRLTREEIQQAVETASEIGIQTDVSLDVFEKLEVFVRGEVMGKRTLRRWWKLWQKEELVLPLYQRLVLILKLKPHRRLDRDIDTDRVYLKVFKDIPRMDKDTLLPGARARLSRLDRALIAYPLAAGVGLMLYNIGANIWDKGAAAAAATFGSVVALWGIALALGGYGYKSYYSYQVKKQTYSLQLTKRLYYQSLDNNTGVLMRVMDDAEEQECRETLLGYFCLWKYAPPQGWTAEQLDDYVEMYLEGAAKLKVDFEIGDALAKLERLRLVVRTGETYRSVPLAKALEQLDWIWDNYFKYNNPEPEEPPSL
jgi:hypothetical protein